MEEYKRTAHKRETWAVSVLNFCCLIIFFTFVAFHCLPKAGVGAITYVFGDLLEGCVFPLHQLICDTHTYCHELFAKTMSGILQNKSFGVSFGDVELLRQIGKIDVFIVIENEKLADKEVIILDFRHRKVLIMVVITKERNIKGDGAVIPRELTLLNLFEKCGDNSQLCGI